MACWRCGIWRAQGNQFSAPNPMHQLSMELMVVEVLQRAMDRQSLQHVVEMDVCVYGTLGKSQRQLQHSSLQVKITSGNSNAGALQHGEHMMPLMALSAATDEQVCRDCWSVAFGNSYNDEERCVLAGYDNGDVKLFDLRMNQVGLISHSRYFDRTDLLIRGTYRFDGRQTLGMESAEYNLIERILK